MKRMRIQLINSPVHVPDEGQRIMEEGSIETYTMPLGLGYITSFLEKNGYEVIITDAYVRNLGWSELEKEIEAFSPDMVGITCLTDQRASVFRTAGLVKNLDSNIKVVLGGPHPSIMYKQILQNYPVDAVVIGEGEETTLRLIQAWEKGAALDSVEGIAFLKDGQIICTPPRKLIENLDIMPLPAYHKIDFNLYKGWDFVLEVLKLRGLGIPDYNKATLITSRGCPSKCNFCSVNRVWGKVWRARSAQNVVNEIEMLYNNNNVRFIIFADDNFSVDQKRVMEISREILKRKLKIIWGFQTGVRLVSSEMLKLAAQAGCVFIIYGVESGSETMLKQMNKKINNEHIINAFHMSKQEGISTGAFLMIGHHGENNETVNQSVKLLKKIKPDITIPQILMLAPGTKLYDKAKQQKLIDDSYWLSSLPLPYYVYENSLDQLIMWYRKLQYYKCSYIGMKVRELRDLFEFKTGFRISAKGVYRANISSHIRKNA